MAWIVDPIDDQCTLAERFRKLVNKSAILQIPGTHDAMAALMAKQVGFQALYLSGAAYTASRGLPDLGMIYSNEMAARAKDIVRATNLPLLVDIDTGYGGILNVARTAREMVEAGAAAVQIEDQQMPKKCGHLNGKKLVSIEEMCAKIAVIKEVAPTLMIVGRTDAYALEGLEGAIARAQKYVEAGADIIFPEALVHEQDYATFCQAINVPVLANMTEFGKTPYYDLDAFQRMGCRIVLYPVTSLRVAAKAYKNVFLLLRETGSQQQALHKMQARDELYDAIHYDAFEALDDHIAKKRNK